ncbi:aspartate aminotransferase family protein [Roseospirillum parvum]|uniref:Adenosylmethionine-8-amino-7-oxononanoate aminotransferase n=1 Tax=Roseospirillum parvum TaxID=83401 RepID=A0A1G7WLL5_9PROT|nr:aspartate aminotransferase family protein [Roseospirillum parvum]SDG72784.1 hypothetical protein SAMN05421742_102245 [Roseospirillum parvum]
MTLARPAASHVFHRHLRNLPETAVGGDGPWLIDAAGRRYLDASGGAAVSALGHNDAHVIGAIKAQLDRLPFAHTGFFTSQPAEDLARRLSGLAPPGLDHVYLVSGGSEAVESALKLARQYFLEIGQPARRRIIARRQSYHGNTLGALAAGGNLWRRAPFEPLLMEVSHVSPCYAYRGMAPDEDEAAYVARLADELDQTIRDLGPESVAAFIAEPVVGATAGAVPAVAGYLKAMRQVCDRHGVLLILDEVMCGMGRTGPLFACAHDDVVPDLLTVAKALGAGYQPLGATLVHRRIHDAIEGGSGFFQHGHTYMGHPTACAAGGAVLDRLLDDGLLARVPGMGRTLRRILDHHFADHPQVGDIRGRGLFLGLELVADRKTKQPFDPALGIAAKVKKTALANGLICYPMSGTIDGQRGDHILLAPPFIMTDSDLEEIGQRLHTTLASVLP